MARITVFCLAHHLPSVQIHGLMDD